MQNLSSCLRKMLSETIDRDIFALSDSLPPSSFLKHCVLVDQSTSDKEVPPGAVKRLLSSPSSSPSFAFVDRTADVNVAVRCIAEACFALGGRSSFAPDIVLVHEAVQTRFTTSLLQTARSLPAFSTHNEQRERFLSSNEEKAAVEILLAGHKFGITLMKSR